MRVEIRTQKGVPLKIPGGETRTNTEYQVYLISKQGEVKVAMFSTPGSFLDGFLSESQAKMRARETQDRLKNFFSSQGQLDGEEAVPSAASPRIVRSSRRPDEPRSFAAANAG